MTGENVSEAESDQVAEPQSARTVDGQLIDGSVQPFAARRQPQLHWNHRSFGRSVTRAVKASTTRTESAGIKRETPAPYG